MKYARGCWKCGSKDVLRVPGSHQSHGYGNNLRLSIFSQIIVTKYVCCNCGFIEDWIDNPYDLLKIKNHYAKTEKQKQPPPESSTQPLPTTNRRSPLIR